MNSLVFLSFLLINITFIFAAENTTFELELVLALHRHGDRIVDKAEVYKTDPYDPEYYVPTGYGQLTKIGMWREYQIGQLLKKLYGDFLGEYKFDKVYAYSTDYNRTKASLQLVLAGLFPPSPSSAWNELLLWTPIPANYKPVDTDFLIAAALGSCGSNALLKVQEAMEKSPKVQEKLSKYKDFFEYVRNKTEIGDTRILSVLLIASNLRAIRSMGLDLPSWCSEEDFEKLYDILGLFWENLTITQELRKQIAGPIVNQFLENLKNHKKDDALKIYVYSAHDLNIAAFTGAHNFTGIPANPDYGSTVIIEKLRGNDDKAYIRMFLWTGVGEKLIKLKLENCDYVCPLTVYEEIVTPFLPDDSLLRCISGEKKCGGTKKLSKKINHAFRMSHAIAGDDVFTFKYNNEIYL